MIQFLYVGIAISAGVLNALQIGMIGGISRRTGPFESTMISMLASVAGIMVLIGILVIAGYRVDLPSPFGSFWPYVLIAIVMTASLVWSGRDLPSWLVITGVASVPYLLAASWVGPRIGLAALFASVVAGQLAGSVTMDHLGMFGATRHPLDVQRGIGLAALGIGVYLIRGRA